jgi:hypothetical protein
MCWEKSRDHSALVGFLLIPDFLTIFPGIIPSSNNLRPMMQTNQYAVPVHG